MCIPGVILIILALCLARNQDGRRLNISRAKRKDADERMTFWKLNFPRKHQAFKRIRSTFQNDRRVLNFYKKYKIIELRQRFYMFLFLNVRIHYENVQQFQYTR